MFEARALPSHQVSIERMFALGKYDVTRGEFAVFVRETGYSPRSGDCTVQVGDKFRNPLWSSWQNVGFDQIDGDPVVCVTWQDAQAYIAWLNDKLRSSAQTAHDGPYRLPTEAEWEYAARAGQRTVRWWGDSIGSNNANCNDCGSAWDGKRTAPVASFRADPFGLYDMLGNVWQWMEDCWHPTYDGAPSDGSAWSDSACSMHVLRGGGWRTDARYIRPSVRTRPGFSDGASYDGFRVAKTLNRSPGSPGQ
jgi:formylglycine-generating enzyme required for sulfatase activity